MIGGLESPTAGVDDDVRVGSISPVAGVPTNASDFVFTTNQVSPGTTRASASRVSGSVAVSGNSATSLVRGDTVQQDSSDGIASVGRPSLSGGGTDDEVSATGCSESAAGKDGGCTTTPVSETNSSNKRSEKSNTQVGDNGGSGMSSDEDDAKRKREEGLQQRTKAGLSRVTGEGCTEGGKRKKKKKGKAGKGGEKGAVSSGNKKKSKKNRTKTASTFKAKNHDQDEDDPMDYEIPDGEHSVDGNEGVRVTNVCYEGDTPMIICEDEGETEMSKVSLIWTSPDDREVFGPQWKRLCDEMGLSDLTYQGKDDPEGRRAWEESLNRSPKKKTRKSPGRNTPRSRALKRSKKARENAKLRQLHHQFGRRKDGKGPQESGGDGGACPNEDEGDAAQQTSKRPPGSPGDDVGASDNARTIKQTTAGSDCSEESVAPTGQAVQKTATLSKGRGRSKEFVNGPTEFQLPKATHGQGCVHCGVRDLVAFDSREYKHYSQPGQFLSYVGECSGRCGIRFDASHKGQASGTWVHGCLVGKRFHTKDRKDYDVECNFAMCSACHIAALERHELEAGVGGRGSRRRRAVV